MHAGSVPAMFGRQIRWPENGNQASKCSQPHCATEFFMRNEVMMSNLVGLHPNIIPVCDVLKSSKGVERALMPVCGDNLARIASTARLRKNGLAPFSVFSAYLEMC
jgi:hypothetical protein